MKLTEKSKQKTHIVGYQQTEVGPIPLDWKLTKIEEIASVKSGKRLPKGTSLSKRKTPYPYIRVIDMYMGGVFTENIMYVPEHVFPFISNYRIFKSDIFISVAGTLGIVGVIPTSLEGANLTENANRLTEIQCDKNFLLYILSSPIIQDVIKNESTIGAQPKLALNRIRNFQVPLPPTLKEQRAIANALCDTDALIHRLERLIAKKRLIKLGAMQELLRPKEGWLSYWMGDLVEIIGGGTPSTTIPEFWEGDVNWFTPTEVGKSKYVFSSTRRISDAGLKASSARLLPVGTILLTTRAGIGNVSILGVEGATNQGFQSLVPKENVNGEFLYYLVLTLKSQLLSKASGSTFLEISPKALREIEVVIPKEIEQNKIASILSDMDRELETLEARLAKYRQVKQGMMQELLTGKTRLVEPRPIKTTDACA